MGISLSPIEVLLNMCRTVSYVKDTPSPHLRLRPALTPQCTQVNHWVSLHFQISQFEHAEVEDVIDSFIVGTLLEQLSNRAAQVDLHNLANCVRIKQQAPFRYWISVPLFNQGR